MISVSVEELSELSVTLSGVATLVFPAHDTELSGTLLWKRSAVLDGSWFYSLIVERLLGFHESLGYIFSPTRRKEVHVWACFISSLPPSIPLFLPVFFPLCCHEDRCERDWIGSVLDWKCVFAFIPSVAFCNKDSCPLLILPVDTMSDDTNWFAGTFMIFFLQVPLCWLGLVGQSVMT